MEIQDVLLQVNDIFKDVLDNPEIIITEKTTSSDVDDWDSLNHIHLIIAIEKHFKMKFTVTEMQTWANVGEMCKAILNKQKIA